MKPPERSATAFAAAALGIGLVALAARVALVLRFPAVHGEDSIARLAHSDTLLLAYQLPFPQLLVVIARAVTPDPLLARLVFSLAGAVVPVALAFALSPVAGRAPGLFAAALAGLHPLLVYYSIVPYQEPVTLALLLAGTAALARGRDGLGALALGLACLSRYEAWIAAALAAWSRRDRPLRALALFGWAPLLWVALWAGLSPAGTYVLDLDPSVDPGRRLAFLWGKLAEYSGWAALALAGAGAAVAFARARRALLWPGAFLLAVLAVVALAGHEAPPGSGRVSERLAHLPALAVCVLAGFALGAIDGGGTSAGARLRGALAVVAAGALATAWAWRSAQLVAEANRDPGLRLALRVARAAHARLPPGGSLAVAAPAVSAAAVDAYVKKVAAAGGDRDRARALALRLSSRPPDAERVAAHLPRPPRAVVSADEPGAELLALFDDAARVRSGAVLLAEFAEGGRRAALYGLPASGANGTR